MADYNTLAEILKDADLLNSLNNARTINDIDDLNKKMRLFGYKIVVTIGVDEDGHFYIKITFVKSR